VNCAPHVAGIEPDERELLGSLIDRRLEARLAAPRDVVDRDDGPADGLDLLRDQARDRQLAGFELVRAREVFEEIAEVVDAQRFEMFRAARTDTFEVIDGTSGLRTQD
jgi:hypothetical protein